jgi:hypothetical protein
MSGTNALLQIGQGVPQPTNPLAIASQAQQFQSNQLAIQQMKARAAVGAAVQEATDPTTGVIDQGKARALIAANPDAALAAQEGEGTTQDQQSRALGNETQTLANQHQKIGFLAGLTAPLAANPNVTKGDVQNTIQHAVNYGLIDAGTAQQVLNGLPNDSAGVRGALGGFLKSTMAPGEEYAHIYGTPSSINNGPNVVSGVTGPADQGGGFNASTATPLGVSPETAASQQTGIDPTTGQPYATTTGARLQGEGAGTLLNPGPTRAAVPGASKYPWNQGGAYGGASGNPAPVDSDPGDFSGGGSSVPAASGAVTTGPAAGVVEGLTTAAHASAGALSDAQTKAASFSTRQYQAKTALGALQQLGPTGTGPGTEGRNALVSYAQSLGFTAPSDKVQAYDEATKYLTQAAMSQPGASGSDSRLATALTGNASTHISNLAAQDVVRANIALDRQNQAAVLAFNQQPPADRTPDKWQTFATNWSSKVDPRAYAFDLMSPAQRTKLVSTFTPTQKATFYGQVQDAVNSGLVQPPQAQ